MTLEEALSLIMSPPQAMKQTLDSRINEPDFIAQLIHEKRALMLSRIERKQGEILPLWEQPYIVSLVDKVDQNEGILFDTEKDFGKFSLPRLVQFKYRNQSNQNRALVSIVDAESKTRFFPTSYEKYKVIERSKNEMSKHDYYFMVGDFVYLTRVPKKISVKGIFFNPLKAHIIDNTIKQSGSLVIGNTYKVANGTIRIDNLTYNAPATFVATNTVYTGSGRVYLEDNYRLLSESDEYPLNDDIIDVIKKMIWNELDITIRARQDEEGNADEEAYNQEKQRNSVPPQG